MKAKITRYLIPLLILTIIITFCSFSCSTPGPADKTIEEPAQETAEEIAVEEPGEGPAEEAAAEEPVVEEVTGETEEEDIEAVEESLEEKEEETIVPEDKKIFGIGDIINIGSLEFSVTGVTPGEGSETINLFIEVSIKNNGDTDRKISAWMMFSLLDEFKRKQTYSLTGSKDNIGSAVIPPGKTLTGEIPFIVPEDVKEFDLEVNLNLSTEELEFIEEFIAQALTVAGPEEMDKADMKKMEELEEKYDSVIVKIFLN